MKHIPLGLLALTLMLCATPPLACEPPTPPPMDRPRPGLLHIPQLPIHPLVWIRTDASVPGSTGTAILEGQAENADEVENFYIAYFREKEWELEPGSYAANQHIFRKGRLRLVMTSRLDACGGFTLTIHVTRG